MTVSDPAKQTDLERLAGVTALAAKIGAVDGAKDADWVAWDGPVVGVDDGIG